MATDSDVRKLLGEFLELNQELIKSTNQFTVAGQELVRALTAFEMVAQQHADCARKLHSRLSHAAAAS